MVSWVGHHPRAGAGRVLGAGTVVAACFKGHHKTMSQKQLTYPKSGSSRNPSLNKAMQTEMNRWWKETGCLMTRSLGPLQVAFHHPGFLASFSSPEILGNPPNVRSGGANIPRVSKILAPLRTCPGNYASQRKRASSLILGSQGT